MSRLSGGRRLQVGPAGLRTRGFGDAGPVVVGAVVDQEASERGDRADEAVVLPALQRAPVDKVLEELPGPHAFGQGLFGIRRIGLPESFDFPVGLSAEEAFFRQCREQCGHQPARSFHLRADAGPVGAFTVRGLALENDAGADVGQPAFRADELAGERAHAVVEMLGPAIAAFGEQAGPVFAGAVPVDMASFEHGLDRLAGLFGGECSEIVDGVDPEAGEADLAGGDDVLGVAEAGEHRDDRKAGHALVQHVEHGSGCGFDVLDLVDGQADRPGPGGWREPSAQFMEGGDRRRGGGLPRSAGAYDAGDAGPARHVARLAYPPGFAGFRVDGFRDPCGDDRLVCEFADIDLDGDGGSGVLRGFAKGPPSGHFGEERGLAGAGRALDELGCALHSRTCPGARQGAVAQSVDGGDFPVASGEERRGFPVPESREGFERLQVGGLRAVLSDMARHGAVSLGEGPAGDRTYRPDGTRAVTGPTYAGPGPAVKVPERVRPACGLQGAAVEAVPPGVRVTGWRTDRLPYRSRASR